MTNVQTIDQQENLALACTKTGFVCMTIKRGDGPDDWTWQVEKMLLIESMALDWYDAAQGRARVYRVASGKAEIFCAK